MNDDYLWDKSGDDPEIKRLEEVLVAFRYEETAAPVLPTAKILAFPARPKRRDYTFAFAIAACAIVAVTLGVWFQFSLGVEPRRDMAQTTPSEVKPELAEEPITKTVNRFGDSDDSDADPAVKQTPVRPRRIVTPPVRARKAVRNVDKATVALTSEEEYAYGQLMLALSITGSKLKIVQDKVNGVEDEKINNER